MAPFKFQMQSYNNSAVNQDVATIMQSRHVVFHGFDTNTTNHISILKFFLV